MGKGSRKLLQSFEEVVREENVFCRYPIAAENFNLGLLEFWISRYFRSSS